MTAHPAIKIGDYEVETLIDKVEEIITSKVHK
jgi:1-acyl-sn-glycerol-3-phosphate acyltransferase